MVCNKTACKSFLLAQCYSVPNLGIIMLFAVAIQYHNSGHVADNVGAGLCGSGCCGKHF